MEILKCAVSLAVLVGAQRQVLADSLKVPEPDAGLLAAVDVQTNVLREGTVLGDFEAWYPGLFPGFWWTRATTEIGSNGLFRVQYAVFDPHDRRGERPRELTILLFRPESLPGAVSRGGTPPALSRGGRPARGHAPAKAIESDLAVGAIEDALVTAQFFSANARYYGFIGDAQSLSFVGQLPAFFPDAGDFGDAEVRRVSFHLQPGDHGRMELVAEHAPLLADVRPGRGEAFRATLAEKVSLFHLQYWDAPATEWVEQWTTTNSLPRMVQVTLGLGKPHGPAEAPHEVASRIVALPATAVPGYLQGAGFPPGGTNGPPGLFVHVQPDAGPTPRAGAKAPAPGAESERSKSRRGRSKGPSKSDPCNDVELDWLARSGIELARYVLAQESSGPFGQVDSLRKKWAGGPGDPGSPVAGIPLDDYELGGARISVHVADTDRKFNINVADEFILRQGLVSIGVDAGAHPTIVEAILDWRDPDDIPRVSGVESAYYLSLSPPHFAKNGPLDDLSELLLVRGVTPALYFGRSSGGPEPAYTTGLVDFFTPWSSRLVNLNTAPAAVLQIFPDLDANIAQAIITARAGLDGVDGTEDDQPFRSPQDIARVPGLNNPAAVQTLARYFTVRSLVFEVTIDLDLDGETREYAGWLTRTSPRDIRILKMYRN